MSNKEYYKEICAQRADLPVFLQYWWLDAVCDQWSVAIAKKGEQVTGVWPYTLETKLGVKIIRNPLPVPYMGPHVFLPPDIKPSNIDGFEHETIIALVQQMPDAPVWDVALQPGLKQAGIFKQMGLMVDVRQTFLIDLEQDEQALLGNMKENMRRNIKAAAQELTITNTPENLALLYDFHKHTLEQKGKKDPYSQPILEKLLLACLKHNAGTIWTAVKGTETQAIIWQVWDAKCGYYFMGSQQPDTENYRAMPYLLWYAMKEAKTYGCNTFDLEGSTDPGVERFFRGFGGTRELYMVIKKNKSALWRLKKTVLK